MHLLIHLLLCITSSTFAIMFFSLVSCKSSLLKVNNVILKNFDKNCDRKPLTQSGKQTKKKKNGKQHSPASLASIFPKWPCRLLVHVKLTVESWQIFNYDMVYEILPRYQYKCQQYSQAYNILIIDFKKYFCCIL